MLGVNNIGNTGELTMDSITQKAKVRLSALKFANSRGVTQAANEFHVSRQSIYPQRAALSDLPENSVKNFTITWQFLVVRRVRE